MLTAGKVNLHGVNADVFCWHRKNELEVCLAVDNTVVSSYKKCNDDEYMFIDSKAKQVADVIKTTISKMSKVKAKDTYTSPFELGIVTECVVKLAGGISGTAGKFKNELVSMSIQKEPDKETGVVDFSLDIAYCGTDNMIPKNMKYVKLTKVGMFVDENTGRRVINTRSLEEISLEKDVTWLKEKKYYIVQDENTAETIFNFLENYSGPIAYDTETTGLKINCFGKYGSVYVDNLKEYNNKVVEENVEKVESGLITEEDVENKKIKADKLVGIIFCWKPNESYYFPCGNLMFDNLYQDRTKEIVKKIIKLVRDRNKVDDKNCEKESSHYLCNTADEELTCDFILMQRVKYILENQHIVAHNGTFEWKVGYMYDIVTNVVDDTMIMHQVTYKFMDTSRNSGEPSSLKHLTKKMFGVDQLDLADFFAGYSEQGSEVRGKKKKKKKGSYDVDFSFMSYNGARAYAPADGDFTLQLYLKFSKDLKEKFSEIEYIYNVEVMTSCAIAYMEFYGHRIDESKIEAAKNSTIEKCKEYERIIRELGGIKDEEEFNVGSPAQVADLFFNRLGIPFKGDKPSVAKKELKAFKGLKDEDGNPKYPIIDAYSEWKKQDTLLTKFFDNLPNFMYPGGFIFSHYKQIETGTGRMSCNSPNAQQYPKVVSNMVCPRDNCVMFDSDYSQIEYRVLTALAKEKKLMEMFKDPDTDYHTLMASIMYGIDYALVTKQMRGDAKSFNFGIPYGMGFGSLAILLRGANTPEFREEAMEKYELYFKDQPNVRQFFDDVKEGAVINGYTRTQFNRRRYYSFKDKDGNFSNKHKARALRQAGNAVIQGCLDGNTRIETKEYGIVKIRDVAGMHLHVWDGHKWSNGDITYSGKKQKCIITFNNGQKFICSPIHKFLKKFKSASDIKNYIKCRDLVKGDAIEINWSSDLLVDIPEDIEDIFDDFISSLDPEGDETAIWSPLDLIDLKVESVEITDEYIDMYDVCNTDGGYYVADGIITHNTAADIFKIAMARLYLYIKKNNLFGKLYITNMVHDEVLCEVDVSKLNPNVVFKDIVRCMSYHIDGFPPLYVGGGFGMSWKNAKGGDAEIHPTLGESISKNAQNTPLLLEKPLTPESVLEYFDRLNLEFRKKKISDYLCNPENFGKALHPAIGSLLNTFFADGVSDDDENKSEKVLENFINKYELPITIDMYKIHESTEDDVEEDEEYEDESEDEDFEDGEIGYSDFALLDESDKAYGVNLVELIDLFGYLVSKKLGVCGIDIRGMKYYEVERISNYLEEHAATEDDDLDDCLEVVLLKQNNIITHTDYYVKDIAGSSVAKLVKAKSKPSVIPVGTIEERCKD